MQHVIVRIIGGNVILCTCENYFQGEEKYRKHIRQMEKLRLGSTYGKCASPDELAISQAGGDGEPAYADTDSMRTKDFTNAELFWGLSNICQECGAIVGKTDKHVEWHNKLLP